MQCASEAPDQAGGVHILKSAKASDLYWSGVPGVIRTRGPRIRNPRGVDFKSTESSIF